MNVGTFPPMTFFEKLFLPGLPRSRSERDRCSLCRPSTRSPGRECSPHRDQSGVVLGSAGNWRCPTDRRSGTWRWERENWVFVYLFKEMLQTLRKKPPSTIFFSVFYYSRAGAALSRHKILCRGHKILCPSGAFHRRQTGKPCTHYVLHTLCASYP